jgi:hypothetical protein
MSDYCSIQMGGSTPETTFNDSDAPAAPRIVSDHYEKEAITVQGDKVTRDTPSEYRPGQDAGDSFLDNGRCGKIGRPLARHELKEDSIVKYGGSEGRINELLALGIVEPDPAGGFREKAQQDRPKEQEQTAAPMEKLSNEGEAFISHSVANLGGASVYSLAQAVIEGKAKAEEQMVAEAASRLGIEPHEMRGNVERLKSEMTTQAVRALSKVGVAAEDFGAFTEWVHEHHPDGVREAMFKQFDNGDLRPLQALGRAYAQSGAAISPDEILRAQFGGGITARREGANVLLSIPGRGTMKYQDAIRLGLVTIGRR